MCRHITALSFSVPIIMEIYNFTQVISDFFDKEEQKNKKKGVKIAKEKAKDQTGDQE